MGEPRTEPHDCNDHMVELDDGFGWDCSVCWNRRGLPLTTGEGNTADDLERALTAAEEAIASGQRAVAGWQECAAECGRLREQLDAARQALTYIAGYQSETQSDAEGVTLMQAAARAALGVGDG